MALKPSLPKGTRDMLPETMLRREYILEIIRNTFRRYGFLPIETPALEKVETLTGKYGEEGDRLIFKIVPRGQKLERAFKSEYPQKHFEQNLEEALRYDLTVPLARFVVQNKNELNFPFKRFQIQPVWRADRPQKGRFREFVQCDADAVGSSSLLQELEFLSIYQDVFAKLQLPVKIKLNNRKLLAGLAESFGVAQRLEEFTIALDKLDKIGKDGVLNEMKEKSFPETATGGFEKMVNLSGSNSQKMQQLLPLIAQSDIGREGLDELRYVLESVESMGLPDNIHLDLTLARGLDYYTGSIFEVTAADLEMGSIGGGGRYQDLTGIFGVSDLPGIGISFGLDRIYLALEEKGLFPSLLQGSTEVMFVNFGEKEALFSLKIARQLRNMGVKTEVYPEPAKMKKQMDYANKSGVEQVVLIGEKEIAEGKFTLKNMQSGAQRTLSRIELLEELNPQNDFPHGHH